VLVGAVAPSRAGRRLAEDATKGVRCGLGEVRAVVQQESCTKEAAMTAHQTTASVDDATSTVTRTVRVGAPPARDLGWDGEDDSPVRIEAYDPPRRFAFAWPGCGGALDPATELGRGEASASALAERLPVTRQAIAKHLAVLAQVGLVEPVRAGSASDVGVLLDHHGRRVDADHPQVAVPGVGEAVPRVGRDDGGVTGARDDLVLPDPDGRFPVDDGPRLGVRVPVQPRPLTRAVGDEEEADPGPVVHALEAQGPAAGHAQPVGGDHAGDRGLVLYDHGDRLPASCRSRPPYGGSGRGVSGSEDDVRGRRRSEGDHHACHAVT